MGGSLAAVVFVFALLGAVLFLARRAPGATAGLSLRVMDAVNLGGGRSVTVVRSGERFFLLGTTAHAVSLIAELEADDVAGANQAAEPGAELPRLPAMSALFKLLRGAR